MLNPADIPTIFNNCLVMHKGKAKLFQAYSRANHSARLLDIETGKIENIEFVFEDFRPCTFRLGYVNAAGEAVYLQRSHRRNYAFSISSANIVTKTRLGRGDIPGFTTPEFQAMMKGDYPTLEDAWGIASAFDWTVAFDRQFVVSCDTRIYYKGSGAVGKYNPDDNSIKFSRGFEALSNLIGDKYVQSVRIARPAAN